MSYTFSRAIYVVGPFVVDVGFSCPVPFCVRLLVTCLVMAWINDS